MSLSGFHLRPLRWWGRLRRGAGSIVWLLAAVPVSASPADADLTSPALAASATVCGGGIHVYGSDGKLHWESMECDASQGAEAPTGAWEAKVQLQLSQPITGFGTYGYTGRADGVANYGIVEVTGDALLTEAVANPTSDDITHVLVGPPGNASAQFTDGLIFSAGSSARLVFHVDAAESVGCGGAVAGGFNCDPTAAQATVELSAGELVSNGQVAHALFEPGSTQVTIGTYTNECGIANDCGTLVSDALTIPADGVQGIWVSLGGAVGIPDLSAKGPDYVFSTGGSFGSGVTLERIEVFDALGAPIAATVASGSGHLYSVPEPSAPALGGAVAASLARLHRRAARRHPAAIGV